MKRRRFTEEPIVGTLKEHKAGARRGAFAAAMTGICPAVDLGAPRRRRSRPSDVMRNRGPSGPWPQTLAPGAIIPGRRRPVRLSEGVAGLGRIAKPALRRENPLGLAGDLGDPQRREVDVEPSGHLAGSSLLGVVRPPAQAVGSIFQRFLDWRTNHVGSPLYRTSLPQTACADKSNR